MKVRWYAKSIYALVALALVLSLGITALPLAGTAEANNGCCQDAWVDDNAGPDWYNVTCHFDTIQKGINAVCENGTVHVLPGKYAGGITVNKTAVTIESTDGPHRTIVQDASAYGFQVLEPRVIVAGFRITGFGRDMGRAKGTGDGPEINCDRSGYGIILAGDETANNCIIRNNIIEDNHHGILIETDNNQILYNNILNNIDYDSGIHLTSCASGNEIHCNNIMGNLVGVSKQANFGVSEEGGGNVNAANNYWGCSEGPGAAGCDTISGPVLYDPWLPRPFELCEVCGGALPPLRVPATNHWGIVAMTTLFAGLLLWVVWRRRVAS